MEATHLPGEAGRQTVDDKGRTWTMAVYTVGMWVPTDDLEKAQEHLADALERRLPSLTQNAPEPYVLGDPDSPTAQ